MNATVVEDVIDVADTNGTVRRFPIQVAVDGLDFKNHRLTDPEPSGRQIIELAGLNPDGDVGLAVILSNGDFEDVRLDERVNLRASGRERFVAFRTDRDFKLRIDGREITWGKPVISGQVLHQLAQPDDGQSVFLEVKGGTDRLVEVDDMIDLDEPGIERFLTAPTPVQSIEIVINARPYTVDGNTITFAEVVALAFPRTANPQAVFSMTYRKAAGNPSTGELAVGGTVAIKKGTAFNVTCTVQS